MEKRGQITVFIIVGIVLLFLSAGIFYITKNTVKETITTEGVPVAQKVPLTFSPIQKYTENCLRSVGKRGLIILGQQGGYINPDVLGKYSTVKPTDSAGINLQPTKVPYWFYSSPQNREDKIVFSTLQPKLYAKDDSSLSIETQMNRYVKEKLDDCLQNYTVFDNQGFKVKYGSKQVLTRVGTSSVNFQLTMMVTATKGESTTKMKIFYVNLPLKLKQYYELATHITQAQKNYSFLENHAMNIVSSFSGVDMQKLPPTVATGFSSVPTFFWTETKVKKDLQRLFTSYIPLLRFLGSNNFYGHIYPDGTLSNFYQGVYDQSVLTLKGAKGVNVNFNYFHWPVYLKTNSKKGVIKPFHFFVKYGVFKMGQQHYETNYDISFPVLVSLKDPAAFGGEGYDFVFALEGNVRNNKKPEPGKFVSAIPKPLPRLACDKNHWDTGILKTVVVDSFTKEPIEKVQIGFSIPDQDDCQIGFTNKQGNLESNYPAIYGGEVTYFKDDYLMNFYPIDTYQYRGNKSALIGYPVAGLSQDMPNKVVELHRVKAINVTVKKRNLKKCMQPLNCKYTLDPFSITTLLLPIPYKDISCEKGKEVCFFDKGLFAEDKPIFNMEVNGSISKYNNYYFTPGVEALDKKEEATIFLDRMFGKNRKVESEVFSVIGSKIIL